MKNSLAWAIAMASLSSGMVCAGQALSDSPHPLAEKAKQPSGTVTGTVYCADTNLPARVAQIELVPTTERGPGQGFNPQTTAITDLEGRFSLSHVPEGRYYIAVTLPGYLDPLADLNGGRLKGMSAEARKEFDARQTTVLVSPKQPATVSLRPERGAEIDGTVLYDDGSPAISLHVDLKPETASSKTDGTEGEPVSIFSFMEAQQRITDDHGRFRILGVAPGKYLVSVTVPTASAAAEENILTRVLESTSMGGLVVYVGGTTRASKAKVIKVSAGETINDADITIPLSTLHTIHGSVIVKSTGQPPPMAVLQLVYADTQEPARLAVAADGEFELTYVPEDSFLLRAIASSETMPKFGSDEEDDGGGFMASCMILRSNGSDKFDGAAQVPVLVKGDVTGITIAVPAPAAAKTAQSPAVPDQSDTQSAVPQ